MCDLCTRREFLGAGAAAGGMVLASRIAASNNGIESPTPRKGTHRICVVFTGAPGPADRGWCADARQKDAIESRLARAEQELGNVELLIGHASTPQDVAALLSRAGPGTPVLAVNLSCFALTRAVQPILDGRHPMVVFSLPASGHDWLYAHRWQRRGFPVTLFPTSDLDELEHALRLLRVIPRMRQARLLLFPPARGTERARSPDEIRRRLGAEVVTVAETTFDDLIQQADPAAVEAEATQWTSGARAIAGPEPEDIARAARVSVALKELVKREQADGLAIGTCMGWLPKGFPCLGFARLRDAGIPAACEGDMDSLLTMLLFEFAFDRPGFQGNSTFDTSRNVVWTAHCTAPLQLDGRNAAPAPYQLRGHSEVGGDGCVPEVFYSVGRTITRAKFVNLDTILASTGRIVEVPTQSSHGCRTQIVTEVRDAAKMAVQWSAALDTDDAMTLLHRVVFYGDHLDSFAHLARLMGWTLIEEG